jgi:membrane protease YdiL (CAAX protease family)
LTYMTYGRPNRGGGRDLIVFDMLTALCIVHFLLKTSGTSLEIVTQIYALMWVMSLLILMMLRVYGGSTGQVGDAVDYDENIQRSHLGWLIGTIAVIAIVNGLAASAAAQGVQLSSWAIHLSSAQVSGTFSNTATVLDDILYNFFLVAQAEETVKVMATLALYRKTRNLWLSAALPIGVWAAFHGYLAYTGGSMDLFIISAFISGVILFVILLKTKSLINAVVAHGAWDCIVLLQSLLH